ncbi:MAG: hypothetical protein Q9222_001102 [Ikaeria aurantiellina]
MPPSCGSKTVETCLIDNFERQWYQWFMIDDMTSSRTQECFDGFFDTIAKSTGVRMKVSGSQWKGRVGKWKDNWGVSKARDGKQRTTPEALQHLNLWYEGDRLVSDFPAFKLDICSISRSATIQNPTLDQKIAYANVILQDPRIFYDNSSRHFIKRNEIAAPERSRCVPSSKSPVAHTARSSDVAVGPSVPQNLATPDPVQTQPYQQNWNDSCGNSLAHPQLDSATDKYASEVAGSATTHEQQAAITTTGQHPPVTLSLPMMSRKRSRRESPVPHASEKPVGDREQEWTRWINEEAFDDGETDAPIVH